MVACLDQILERGPEIEAEEEHIASQREEPLAGGFLLTPASLNLAVARPLVGTCRPPPASLPYTLSGRWRSAGAKEQALMRRPVTQNALRSA